MLLSQMSTVLVWLSVLYHDTWGHPYYRKGYLYCQFSAYWWLLSTLQIWLNLYYNRQTFIVWVVFIQEVSNLKMDNNYVYMWYDQARLEIAMSKYFLFWLVLLATLKGTICLKCHLNLTFWTKTLKTIRN